MRFNPPYCFANLSEISFSVVFILVLLLWCDSSEDCNKLYNDHCKLLSKNGSGTNKSQILLETQIQILNLRHSISSLFKLFKVTASIFTINQTMEVIFNKTCFSHCYCWTNWILMVAHFRILNYIEKVAGKLPFCSNL